MGAAVPKHVGIGAEEYIQERREARRDRPAKLPADPPDQDECCQHHRDGQQPDRPLRRPSYPDRQRIEPVPERRFVLGEVAVHHGPFGYPTADGAVDGLIAVEWLRLPGHDRPETQPDTIANRRAERMPTPPESEGENDNERSDRPSREDGLPILTGRRSRDRGTGTHGRILIKGPCARYRARTCPAGVRSADRRTRTNGPCSGPRSGSVVGWALRS